MAKTLTAKTLAILLGIGMIGTIVGLTALAKDSENDSEQEDAVAIGLDKIPAAARDALKGLAGAIRITQVTMEDEDGVKVYEGSWKVKGVEYEAEVTEHGDVVETEEIIGWAAVPKAVQNAAAKSFPKNTKLKIEKKTIVLYEFEAEIGGKEREILVSPTGQQVEIEHDHHDHHDHDDAQ